MKFGRSFSTFDGYGSLRDYLDLEFQVNQVVGGFPYSSYRLGKIIAKKLTEHVEIQRILDRCERTLPRVI